LTLGAVPININVQVSGMLSEHVLLRELVDARLDVEGRERPCSAAALAQRCRAIILGSMSGNGCC